MTAFSTALSLLFSFALYLLVDYSNDTFLKIIAVVCNSQPQSICLD